MTDADFIAWLKTPERITCVLVEALALVNGVETTRYLSSTGYTTGTTDSPPSTHYLGCIVGGARITERLSLDGTGASMAFGDIELDNTEGNLDEWLQDVWVNRQVRMYVGDMRWARADFRLVFDGISADLVSRARDRLNLTLRDKLQRLNTAVSETKLGGDGPNADRLLPVCLGEVHNIEPLLVDKAMLKFQVHNGPIERIIEVRDSGVVVAHTANLAAGTFTLSATPAGTITCSVQGAKLDGAYVNTTAKLVELLATEYGNDPFTSGDLDAANLAAFDAANPQPIGVYLLERENVLALCQAIAASVGAQVVMSPAGKLQLLKLTVPVAGTEVTAASMAERSLRLADRIPVVAAVKLGYCKNWTVQTGLQTGIPAEHRDLFAQEWLTATASNEDVAAAYKLTQEPQQQNTLLLVREDAIDETSRRLALWGEPRTVFAYEGEPELLLEQLGGFQTITHDRFGLSEGVHMQIVGIERDWLDRRAVFSVISGGDTGGSETAWTPRAICFALDRSTSMLTNSRFATMKATMSTVLDMIKQRVGDVTIDLSVVTFGPTNLGGAVQSIVRRGASIGSVDEVNNFVQALTAAAFNTDFRDGATAAASFFNGTAGSITDRYLFWITDGEPGYDGAGSVSPVVIATSAKATLDALAVPVRRYGINVDLVNTTYTAYIDNTASDGIPVITGTNQSGLISAVTVALNT